MFTALARFWSAAGTPARAGSTSSSTSRNAPARRAVTTPDSLPGAIATASPMSPELCPGPDNAATPTAAGAGTDVDEELPVDGRGSRLSVDMVANLGGVLKRHQAIESGFRPPG